MQSKGVGKFCSKQFGCNKRINRGCIKRILLYILTGNHAKQQLR